MPSPEHPAQWLHASARWLARRLRRVLPLLVLAVVAAAAHVTAAVVLAGIVRTVTVWQHARAQPAR